MNVLIATGLYPPEIGGPATYTVLLEQELPKKGVQVSTLPFSTVRQLPRIVRHVAYFFKLLKLSRKADIIFAQDIFSVGVPAVLAAKVAGKKIFVRVPGDYAWEQATQRFGVKDSIDDFQKNRYGLKVELFRSVQRWVTKHADEVITPSNYFRELVTKWGVRPEKITTIYNGVSLDITPVPVSKPSSLTIVSCGRLVPWKGFVALIEMMKALPVWHLVILGDGPEKESLATLIKESGLESRVHLIGKVSREEVFGWCSVADVFVLNTHFESFSYQIVEAMYAGVPVVTTNVGSIPELLSSGEEGLLLDPDDREGMIAAIGSVITDKTTWQRRVIAAKQKAGAFSIEATTSNLYEIIKSYET